jgi:hypothetical protein
MKKELLVASALVSTLGMAGVAEAATATMSGSAINGVVGKDLDSTANDSTAATQLGKFSVSLSETTDGGVKISTGFDLTNESDAVTDVSGVTLTFNDGSKLDLVEAGTASGSHVASVPGASGQQGISGTTTNAAPGSLTMGNSADSVGFEYHTAADAFGIDGFKASVSASFNGDTSSVTGTTAVLENSYSAGVTYVTDAGDTTVTIAGGVQNAEYNNSTATMDTETYQIGLSAVNGDLTVGVGYADGDFIRTGDGSSTGRSAMQVSNASFAKAGVKYVSGDMTFSLGTTSAEGKDEALGAAATSTADSKDSTSASVDYAVASGVTATLGWTDVTDGDEGTTSTNTSGSSWYVGANISF